MSISSQLKQWQFKQLAAAVFLATLTSYSYAAEQTLDLSLPARGNYYGQDNQPFLLAENSAGAVKTEAAEEKNVTPAASKFEPSLFSGSKIHQYLGVGTMVMAGMTFISHKHPVPGSNAPRDLHGAHAHYGQATAIMAAATVASGLLSHWDDFSLEDGWSDPDNLHVVLAVSGAALMAYAINKSMNSTSATSHAGLAEAGALGMGLAIKLTW